jgi:hypothetical protein
VYNGRTGELSKSVLEKVDIWHIFFRMVDNFAGSPEREILRILGPKGWVELQWGRDPLFGFCSVLTE